MEVYHTKQLRERENKSLREIARETGHDFRTVKKYAEQEDFKERKAVQKKRSKQDPYKATIDKWLEEDRLMKAKQRHTAKAIYNRLCRENGQKFAQNEKFPLSERTVRIYVSQKKKELYSPKTYLKLEHDGGEAQADFGEADFGLNGRKQTLKYLILSYPHSNGAYMQAFKGENPECLLEGLKRIFEYVGRVPTKIWFDNLKPIVKEIFKHCDRALSERFKRFSLLVPSPEADDMHRYNQELLPLCDADMNRIHYSRRENIRDLFTPFDICKLIKAKTNKYGMVTLDCNKYSVSPKYIQRQV